MSPGWAAWSGGDMGTSYVSGLDVAETFASKLPATLLLTALSILATILISIPLGILAAVFRGRAVDYILRFISFIGNSLPNFFCCPSSHAPSIDQTQAPSGHLGRYLTAQRPHADHDPGHCHVFQIYASGQGGCSGGTAEDYVIGAKARGVRSRVTLWNSCHPFVHADHYHPSALSIGNLLGGTAIIESIFMWDGVAKWLSTRSPCAIIH